MKAAILPFSNTDLETDGPGSTISLWVASGQVCGWVWLLGDRL